MDTHIDIRFYDNERDNWVKDMKIHKEIAYLEVDEETPNELIASFMDTSLKKNALNQLLNKKYNEHFLQYNNTYAIFINESQKGADKKELDKIIGKAYPTNGMDEYIDNLLEWSSSPQNKVALFDWDRTITAVEGMYIKGLAEKVSNGDIKIDDLIVYVMGGEERLQKYKNLFSQLSENKLTFFVLTHNSNASIKSPLRKVYVDMIHAVTGSRTAKDIIDTEILFSSSDHLYKKHISACATTLKKYLSNCAILAQNIPREEKKELDIQPVENEKVEQPPATTKKYATKRKMDESMIDTSVIMDIPEPVSEPAKTATKRKRTIKGGNRKSRRRNHYNKTRKNRLK